MTAPLLSCYIEGIQDHPMKILHTSDWHLGQALYGRKRNEEFRLFLDWLAQTLREESIDVLLVSGDIFDSGLPSNQAQALYYRFLCEAAKSSCRHIVLTAGNHDSPSFLDAPQALLQALDVHVIGQALEPEEEVLLLNDANGLPELIVCAVPFLRDRDLYRIRFEGDTDDREALLAHGMREHYRRCAAKADALLEGYAQNFPNSPTLPVVAMGHLFAAGGTVGDDDGVRDLRIGSLGQISADIFPSCFDYVALGHLHRPQKVNKEERIRYSGSPLPMGFGEAKQQKNVCLVEFEGKTPSVRTLDVPLFQKMEKISGDLPSIEARLKELSELGEAVWLEVTYTGSAIVSDLRERLQEKAGPKLEILRVRTAYSLEAPTSTEDLETALEDMSVFDVFTRRLDDFERQNGLDAEQRKSLLETYAEAVNELLQVDKGEEGCAS